MKAKIYQHKLFGNLIKGMARFIMLSYVFYRPFYYGKGFVRCGAGLLFDRVAVCTQKGLWVSNDKGKSWKQTSELAINSIINIRTKPDNIYALTNDELYISTDFGVNFAKVEDDFPQNVDEANYIRVAPYNLDHMIFWFRGTKYVYDNHTYYTKDGGRQAGYVEFNKTTREVFVSCGCRGFWKIAACDASKGK